MIVLTLIFPFLVIAAHVHNIPKNIRYTVNNESLKVAIEEEEQEEEWRDRM